MSSPAHSGAAHRAAARVARNTAVRALADIVGKFASLALLAVLARKQGPAGLGVLIFAFAWCEIATAPIDMGYDRYLLRRVALDRGELDTRFFNVIVLKLARAVPVIAASWLLVWVLGYDGTTRATVYLMTGSLLLDGLAYTVFAAFNAVERAELIAASLILQRFVSAGLGLTLLALGLKVVAVAGAYFAASGVAFALAIALLWKQIGMPARAFPRAPRRDLMRKSLPFAAQDLLSVGLARLDAVLLSLLATKVTVGYYGSAYRLLEATLFISAALQGAFAAMYTYLDHQSDPTINAVFQRSIKVSLSLLTPCAVVLAVLAHPILALLFGPHFGPAAAPLRLLAITTVPLGLVMLSTSLISSRRDPKILVAYFGVVLVINVGMNAALIPPLGATGAALAMLTAEVAFAYLTMRLSVLTVGALHVGQTVGAALTAGAAMAIVAFALHGVLAVALCASALTYIVVFGLAERWLAPGDFRFMVDMVRARLPLKSFGYPVD